MLVEWIVNKLESISGKPRILVTDALRLLPDADGTLHRFARQNGYTVIMASTNLVFRELYEQAAASPDVEKILIIDRAPIRRRQHLSTSKAPPPFYPDVLAEIPEEARISIDLRQFLIEKTGDQFWPQEINNPRLARLIASKLAAVFTAHKRLRAIEPQRFTDSDLKTIVSFAALGLPEIAFTIPQPQDYWKLGMLGHDTLEELDAIAPEITSPIRDGLRKAPVPFCWFSDRDPDIVVRIFYLVVIISQHCEQWRLVMKAIDADITGLESLDECAIRDIAPKLVAMDREQAEAEIGTIEKNLSKHQLQVLLLDGLKLNDPAKVPLVVVRECYSNLVRSLCLLLGLEDLLASSPKIEHAQLRKHLIADSQNTACLADLSNSPVWFDIKKAYLLGCEVTNLYASLVDFHKFISAKRVEDLQLDHFLSSWRDNRLCRIEYCLSSLERLVWSAELLPLREDLLPSLFINAVSGIRERLGKLSVKIQDLLADVNCRFQHFVRRNYSSWMKSESEVILTSGFFSKFMKSRWDCENEQAVIFVFDGMRLDIWAELVKPLVEERFETITDSAGMSLLPTETHVSRKAIFAGAFPDSFDSRASEDTLLAQTMKRDFRISEPVEVTEPQGPRTGETVRYRCGKLDVFIFDLCDKELHKIQMKARSDGTWEPSRPLSFIYQQHIKNIIDTEVMAVIRRLAPGTKVFITADHGFGLIGRERIRIDIDWVNEPSDCNYQNVRLVESLDALRAPGKVRQSVIEFDMKELRLPLEETRYDKKSGHTLDKKFKSLIFPIAGNAFARPGYPFNPDAFSHGGISLQEMLVPMMAFSVREPEHGLLNIIDLVGQDEILEGEEASFKLDITCNQKVIDDVRIEIDGHWGVDNKCKLVQQVIYAGRGKRNVEIKFKPDADTIAKEDRIKGIVIYTLFVSLSYRHDGKLVKRNREKQFQVRLNPERVIRRVPTHLGAILGLTPKSMR